MERMLFSGRASRSLAERVAWQTEFALGRCRMEDYPDGEIRIHLEEPIAGREIFLLQSTGPPTATNLLELLLLADACRRAEARHLTAVVPYFGYARQNRRAKGLEPVGARLIADLLGSRFDRVITVDLHDPAIEGFFSLPMRHLSAVPLLAEALRGSLTEDDVVVAPDLGAVRLAQRFADHLDLPVATIHKERLSGDNVRVRRIVGNVRKRRPILVDDMISTGGTLASAVEALLEAGCRPQLTIAASHGLLVGNALPRLAALPVTNLLVTDSVPPPADPPLQMTVVGLAGLLAKVVKGSDP